MMFFEHKWATMALGYKKELYLLYIYKGNI
jgi:hypothetical protein